MAKNFRDSDLKGRVLQQIHHFSMQSQQPTGRQLFDAIKHPNFDSFLSTLHRLKKYSYVSIIPDTRPYQYKLTRKGVQHAHDPYKYKRIKQQHLQERISAILNDNEKFDAAVQEEVKQRLKEIDAGIRERPVIETIESKADTELRAELEAKDSKIHELQAQIQHLRCHKSNVPTRPPPVEKSPEEQREETERIQRRQNLAMSYRGRYLNPYFFSQWGGDIYPCRMKGATLYKESSVEIISKSNPEFRRGHAKILPPSYVVGAQLHITKLTKNHIIVSVQCLPGGECTLRF